MELPRDTIELRIALTEAILVELLWRSLTPDALVFTSALNDAIAQQQAIRGVSLDGYVLSGISVTVEPGTMHAELAYTSSQGEEESPSS
jgi:hypothetical protein